MAHQLIGIIGAGPAGLSALKAVMDTPQYRAGLWVPTVFEARENVGGVWLPSASLQTHPHPTSQSLPPPPPPTPLYDSLTTNLPHPVMAFTAFPFPPSTPLFPKAHVVQTYLEAYAAHFELHQHIQLNTRVTKADWDIDRGKWVVQTLPSSSSSSSSGQSTTLTKWTFDLLLICNGHHNLPRYPFVPGLESWLAKGKAAHSMYYRNPSSIPTPSTSTSATATRPLKDQTILVIGGGPSGSDITAELVPLAGRVLHSFSANSAAGRASSSSSSAAAAASSSTTQPSTTPPDPNSNPETLPDPLPTPSSRGATPKPRTTWFHDDGTVQFEDGSEEKGVDYCILATGYEVDFPFFTASNAPSSSANGTWNEGAEGEGDENEDERLKDPNFELSIDLVPYLPPHISHLPETELINTTYGVFPLARHLFGIPGGNFSQDSKGQNPQSRPSSPSSSPKLPPPTSLAFLGLLVRVAPLPLVEVQARAALAAFAVGSSPSSSLSSPSPSPTSTSTSTSTSTEANESPIDWHLEETKILKRWQDLRIKFEGASAPSTSISISSPPPRTTSQPSTPSHTPSPSTPSLLPPQPSHTKAPPQTPPSLSAELDLRTFISKEWHKLSEEGEQFDYRDELDEFAYSLLSTSPTSSSSISDPPSALPNASPASSSTHSFPAHPAASSPASSSPAPQPIPPIPRTRVKPWERHFYTHKNTLRKAWRELEARGWAEEWVRGVGSGELDIPDFSELGVGVELPDALDRLLLDDEGGADGGGRKKQTREEKTKEERAEAEWVWFMGKVLEFGRGL